MKSRLKTKSTDNTKKKLSKNNIKTIGSIFNIGLFAIMMICLVLVSFDTATRNTLINMNTQYLKIEYLSLKENGKETDFKEADMLEQKSSDIIICKIDGKTKEFNLSNIVYVKELPKYNTAYYNNNIFIKYDSSIALGYILNVKLLHIIVVSALAILVTLYMKRVKNIEIWGNFVVYLYLFSSLYALILSVVILLQAKVV